LGVNFFSGEEEERELDLGRDEAFNDIDERNEGRRKLMSYTNE
jgi:hypothetical protein